MHYLDLLSILASSILAVNAAESCPPLGAILPAPTGPLSSSATVQQAAQNLSASLADLLSTDNTTSLAVQVASLDDAHPLFSFYHTAPQVNLTGASSVTSRTQFRIGSVTKVFTILCMLQREHLIDWTAPITKYVPELLGSNSSEDGGAFVRWDQVTLDSLASQLGGIPRDIQDLSLLYNLPWTDLGFPALGRNDVPPCGVASNLPPCNTSAYIDAIKVRRPVYAPYKTPVYSNAAYALLDFALERVLRRDYTSIVQQDIFEPLQMKDSSVNTPEAKRVLIPLGDSQWDLDDGFIRPTGQLYTSIADLSTFALSILNSTLLTPTQVNHWLKPRSHTSSLTASVGAPWEIYRTDTLTPDGRVIDLYTKNGGIGEYSSYLVLVPDYNVSVTVLAAGPSPPLTQITESVLKNMILAVDKLARSQSSAQYVGFYKGISGHGQQQLGSNMSIIMTDTGLRVDQWYNEGKDILAEYASIFQPFKLGLYPTGLRSALASKPIHGYNRTTEPAFEESWRGVYQFYEEVFDGFLDQCSSWLGIDGNVYGQEALDEFVFEQNEKGKIVSVQNSALRTLMYKQ